MALSESALSELLDAFRAGDGVDLIRESVRMLLQELIEVEAAEVIGAGRYERSDERVTDGNGHRPRLLATQAGDIELGIPKLRRGSFFPSILEHRRRIDRGRGRGPGEGASATAAGAMNTLRSTKAGAEAPAKALPPPSVAAERRSVQAWRLMLALRGN